MKMNPIKLSTSRKPIARKSNLKNILLVLVALVCLPLSSLSAATIYVTADDGTTNLFGTLNVTTGQFTMIAETTPLFYALTAGPGGRIYGADLNSGNLYTISASGETAQYGEVTAPGAFNGLAYSPSSGNFFADNVDTTSVTLYSIAGNGNSSSLIGPLAGPDAGFFPTGNLAFGPGGKLYFNYSSDTDNATNSQLYTINTSTGALTAVGSGLGTQILVLFYDGTTLYGIDTFITSDIGVYTINTTSGIATRISTVTGLPSEDYFVDTAAASVAQLLNLSGRQSVLTGDKVLIGGLIITGSQNKHVLARGIGPSLSARGVPGVLSDPMLKVFNSSGTVIATNDNWQTTILGGQITSDQSSAIGMSGLSPGDSHESALILDLTPGGYTAILSGKDNGTGVGLIETYDLDQDAPSSLGNISARGFVGTGENVMIGGFIAGPTNGGSAKVLVRAIGPSLPLSGALADPTLELHDGNGMVIGSNDNWRDTQQSEIQATGIPPMNDFESALLKTLAPGAYTVIVRGKNNSTGIGLVEVYAVP